MKAEDLMIGDYCRVWREGLCIKNKGTIVKVLGIDAEKSLKEKGLVGCAHCHPLDGDQFDGGIWCEYLDPIPLTVEILEKNGFNYVKETGYMCYEQLGDRQYNLIAVKGNILQMQFTSGNLEWTECRYVHDLQHALRLCGIEKEIVL